MGLGAGKEKEEFTAVRSYCMFAAASSLVMKRNCYGSRRILPGLDTGLGPDLAMNAPLGGGSAADVVRFFKSLSDGAFGHSRPAAVPSGLVVGARGPRSPR